MHRKSKLRKKKKNKEKYTKWTETQKEKKAEMIEKKGHKNTFAAEKSLNLNDEQHNGKHETESNIF